MGSVMIKEGDDSWLVDVPTNKMVNADVIRSGDCVFIKYTKTKFRCHEFSVCRLYKTEQWAFPLCLKSWPWQREYMNVLVKIGLMTKERRDELSELDRQKNEASQRKWDSERLTEIANRWGLSDVAKAAAALQPTLRPGGKEQA